LTIEGARASPAVTEEDDVAPLLVLLPQGTRLFRAALGAAVQRLGTFA
jgi:hypothetical protein